MGKTYPLVSVVIPTYNRASYIKRSTQSALQQSYQNIEVIIVDDASTDHTFEIVSAFKDSRIVYLKNKKNSGAPASRNRGIKAAAGEYIALLDDDDEWLPDKIEKQLKVFSRAQKSVGLVYSGFHYVSEKSGKRISTVLPDLKGDVYVDLLGSCILGSPTPLIKKECFTTAGFYDEQLPGAQDWDMWMRIGKIFDFDFVPEALAYHHVHGDQISTNLKGKIIARTILLNKYRTDLEKYPNILSNHLKHLGILYALSGGSWKAVKLHALSLVKFPFQISGYCHFMLSMFPPVYKKILKKYSLTKIEDIIFYY